MTKKDYILIASAINNACTSVDKNIKSAIAKEFARVLKEENPQFNREKFYKACGVSEAV